MKYLILILLFISTSFSHPDTQPLLNESKSILNYFTYFNYMAVRDGSDVSHGSANFAIGSSYKKFVSNKYSLDCEIAYGFVTLGNIFSDYISPGIGATRYFLKEGRGLYLSALIDYVIYFGDLDIGSAIRPILEPGYIIEIADTYYFNSGIKFSSEYEFTDDSPKKFKYITASLNVGVSHYW